jgi:DNA-binding transcriptional MerR regulator
LPVEASAGILRPSRTPSGYRVFDDGDVRTVAHTQTLLAAGLGTDLIKEIRTARKLLDDLLTDDAVLA